MWLVLVYHLRLGYGVGSSSNDTRPVAFRFMDFIGLYFTF
jgi:hypothetical protein